MKARVPTSFHFIFSFFSSPHVLTSWRFYCFDRTKIVFCSVCLQSKYPKTKIHFSLHCHCNHIRFHFQKSKNLKKMAKSKAIEKNCPDCQARVAVASKSCKCGHTFFVERKSVRNTREKVTDQPTNDIDLSSDRRRTARLRRVRPQYYDSQEFEKKTKKKDRKVSKALTGCIDSIKKTSICRKKSRRNVN